MQRYIKNLKKLGGILLATGVIAMSNSASAVPVSLELVLLTDSSGSISNSDFGLMMGGYESAFQNAAVQTAIANAPGGIAVSLAFFSSNGQFSQSIGWTHLQNATDANAFAATIAGTARPFSSGTGLASGIAQAGALFANNGFEGARTTLDVAGDGSESESCSYTDAVCVPVQNARDGVLGTGATINALWIQDSPFFGGPGDQIDALVYGATNVIGGPNSFQNLVSGFGDFESAITQKIGREINPVPEPGMLTLLGLGILGIGLRARKANA